MGDFDEKVGFETIKESMGLTDSDFTPSDAGADLGSDASDSGGFDDEGRAVGPESGDSQSNLERAHDPARTPPDRSDRVREQPRAQAKDPLRQQALKFDPNASFRQDKKGNLIDTKTGEVIARAGSEARIYQRVHKQASDYVRATMRHAQNTISDSQGKLRRAVEIGLGFEREAGQLKQAFNRINAHQLQTDQLLEAAQYYKQAQTDPVGVLKNLLTRAAIAGIDVTQLGVAGGGALDPKAVVDLVRKEINAGVAPLRNYAEGQQRAQQDRQVQSQYLQQAERTVNSFFANTPSAVPYMHIFHAVLSQPQFQNMPLGAIWDKLQLHLLRSNRAPTRSAPQRGAPRSLPNGQGMAPFSGDRNGRDANGPAHPSKSYDSIIRELLQ